MTGNNNLKRYGQFLRKSWGSIIIFAIAALLILSPASKAWVIRQLLRTGFFNAHVTNAKPVSSTAADFIVGLRDGKTIRMSSLRGKVVFINFWASWCPPCRAEFPGIVSLYHCFKNNKRVVFLFVNEDNDLHAGEEFLKQENYQLPLAIDQGGIPFTIYNGSLPTTVVLNKAGQPRFHHEGFAAYDSPEFIAQLDHLTKE